MINHHVDYDPMLLNVELQTYNDIRVTYDDWSLEFLDESSRQVFGGPFPGIVVKTSTNYYEHRQNLMEAWFYHEIFDDEARTLCPEVLDFGFDPDQDVSWCVSEYVDFTNAAEMRWESQPERFTWLEWIFERMAEKFGIEDMYDTNTGWTDDGRPVLFDLGCGSKDSRDHAVERIRTPKSDTIAMATGRMSAGAIDELVNFFSQKNF